MFNRTERVVKSSKNWSTLRLINVHTLNNRRVNEIGYLSLVPVWDACCLRDRTNQLTWRECQNPRHFPSETDTQHLPSRHFGPHQMYRRNHASSINTHFFFFRFQWSVSKGSELSALPATLMSSSLIDTSTHRQAKANQGTS